jgi:peroxiredoxin
VTAGFYVSYIALWILVVFQAFVIVGLVRSVYRNAQRLPRGIAADEGLRSGEPAPEFFATDIHGHTIGTADLEGRQTALLFVSPSCSGCAVTLQELEALRQKAGGHVVVVCQGDDAACRELSDRYRVSDPFVVDADRAISESFRVSGIPTAALVDDHARIVTYGHPDTVGIDVNDAIPVLVTQHGGHDEASDVR